MNLNNGLSSPSPQLRNVDELHYLWPAELLNAFNRHTFGGISTNPNSVTFGNVTSVSGNRTVQLGTRIDF